MSTPSIAERVAAGVQWLDAEVPGWVEEIDLEQMNMASCCRCALGQIYGDYDDSPMLDRADDGVRLGFLATTDRDEIPWSQEIEEAEGVEYKSLTTEWVRVIQERRQAAGEAS